MYHNTIDQYEINHLSYEYNIIRMVSKIIK